MAIVGRTTNTLKSIQTYSEPTSQLSLLPDSIPNILVVIDAQVDDYPTLVNGLTNNATSLVLKKGQGLRDINKAIALPPSKSIPLPISRLFAMVHQGS